MAVVSASALADTPRVFVTIRALTPTVQRGVVPEFEIVLTNETSSTLWLANRASLNFTFSVSKDGSALPIQDEDHWSPPESDFVPVGAAENLKFVGKAFGLGALDPGNYAVKATYRHRRFGDELYDSESNEIQITVVDADTHKR